MLQEKKMVQYKTEALVLRSRRYKEADGILTLLTRERGKINAVAKSIYKPISKLRGGVQPFSLNMMQLNSGRNSLHSVYQSECLDMFLPLRRSFDTLAQASYWAELLDCFTAEEQKDEDLFELAVSGFKCFAQNAGALTIHALTVRLMQQLGLAPSLSYCSNCGKAVTEDMNQYFLPSQGGVICQTCIKDFAPQAPIQPTVISLWKTLENIRMDKLDRIKIQPSIINSLDKVLKDWIVYQSGRPMKSWRVFNKTGGVYYE